MKVYLDANVIIDVALVRKDSSIQIFSNIMNGDLTGYVGSLSYSICNYVIEKQKNKSYARKFMTEMRDNLKLVSINEKVLNSSIASDLKDFEDALQYECAIKSKADFLLTSNKKDFPAENWIVSPDSFIASF